MRFSKSSWILALAVPALFASNAARADQLAPGDPANLLVLDEDFIDDLDQPTSVAFLPDGKILVTEKGGALKVFDADGSPLNDSTDHFVAHDFDVDTESEKGLLNVLVHPDFATNRRLIFYYSAASQPDSRKNRVATAPLREDYTLDLGQEQILIDDIWGPANHDGGALAIANGMLYVGVGDTGCNKSPITMQGEPRNYFATCLTNVNGKILRINLDGSIPSTNPLASLSEVTSCNNTCPNYSANGCNGCDGNAPSELGAPRTEIFAWGIRNPWRIWADPQTNYVWVGDVGENNWEEINVITEGGKHFGWPFREGSEGRPATTCAGVTTPDPGNCVDPVYAYPHADGLAVTGGPIVDDCRWPEALRNRYYFSDPYGGEIWSLAVNSTRDGVTGERATVVTGLPGGGFQPGGVVSFTMGPEGALYYVAITGRVGRLAPQQPIECEPGTGGAGGGSSSGGSAGSSGGAVSSGGSGGAGTGGSAASGGVGGVPGTGGGMTGTGGTTGTGGGSNGGSSSGDDGGCGCRVGGRSASTALGLFGILAGAAAYGSRRRTRARARR